MIWETLLFYDSYNHCGIVAPDAGEDEDDEDEGEGRARSQADEGELQVVSNWNMADYLPSMAKGYFEVITAEFCVLPYKHLKAVDETHPSQVAHPPTLSQNFGFVRLKSSRRAELVTSP